MSQWISHWKHPDEDDSGPTYFEECRDQLEDELILALDLAEEIQFRDESIVRGILMALKGLGWERGKDNGGK